MAGAGRGRERWCSVAGGAAGAGRGRREQGLLSLFFSRFSFHYSFPILFSFLLYFVFSNLLSFT
jgi:hypothetical protein